jgi:hypothetical protein
MDSGGRLTRSGAQLVDGRAGRWTNAERHCELRGAASASAGRLLRLPVMLTQPVRIGSNTVGALTTTPSTMMAICPRERSGSVFSGAEQGKDEPRENPAQRWCRSLCGRMGAAWRTPTSSEPVEWPSRPPRWVEPRLWAHGPEGDGSARGSRELRFPRERTLARGATEQCSPSTSPAPSCPFLDGA